MEAGEERGGEVTRNNYMNSEMEPTPITAESLYSLSLSLSVSLSTSGINDHDFLSL